MISDPVPSPTDRLRFRQFRTGDLGSVMEMFSDDESRRWYPTKASRVESLAWINWNLDNYRRHGFGLWVVEARDSGQFLGDCGLTYQDVEGESQLEIGYHLQSRHRGRGYALEAATACLAYAFDSLDVDTVCSIVDPENEASKRVSATIHTQQRGFTTGDGLRWDLFWTDRSITPSATDVAL